jgi:superfamily II DNA or RNA helicase
MIKRENIIKQLESYGSKVYLIIDEAHRAEFNATFDALTLARRIGFTATPAYKWAKHLPKYYQSLIHGPQPKELIAMGNITHLEYHEMQSADLSGLVKRGGEFTEQSQSNIFDKAKLYDGLFDELPKFKFNKCMVFCSSKKSADLLNNQFLEHKYNSVVYYSGLKHGAGELAQFTKGEANVLVTVAALSEGFDYPPCDFGIIWRATTSLPLFIQMGMRPLTPYKGKLLSTVLDFGGNHSRFGSLIMDRDWHALWQPEQPKEKMSNGVAPIKNCPSCDYIISAMGRSCSNCGYIYPASEMELKQGELVKIEEGLNQKRNAIGAMGGRRISELSPSELALYAVEKNKKVFCMRVAKSQELVTTGFAVEYGKAIGYKVSWANRILMEQAEIKMYEPDYKIEFSNYII